MSLLEYPMEIHGVSDQFIAQHPKFCSQFEDEQERKMANYIYQSSALANLTGRHFEKKRNLISQAEKLYSWTLHPLTEECHPHCPRILADIGLKDREEMEVELQNELKALNFILSHFAQLHQKGYVICIEGKPAAFSIYEKLNLNTAVIHFEKAERRFKGLYQLINRETAKAIFNEGFEFINREEDLGIEGLRKAKMSYHPIELVNSHILRYKTR